MKSKILATAIQVLSRQGLSAWTVERVAHDTGCAKGLVHYHFRNKSELLTQVAAAIGERQQSRRVGALRATGASSLDLLWEVLVEEVRSGEFGAWIALVAHPDLSVRAALRLPTNEVALLGAAAIEALDLEASPAEVGRLIVAGLHGFQLSLLRGEEAESAHEAYHRFWLGVIG